MLDKLKVRDFRCIPEAELALEPGVNWIIGENASGKTSLLEALFYLGHSRSFRTARSESLIREGSSHFELVGWLRDAEEGQRVLGMSRSRSEATARLGGEPLKTLADAARAFPVVVLDSEMNRLISEGPGERRRWLDWGVFHVEQGYLSSWREYRRLLRQRNQALKDRAAERVIEPWTRALVAAGELLDEFRYRYLEQLEPVILDYAARALGLNSRERLEIQYRRGWGRDANLLETLTEQLPKDRETGTTRAGPHRADVRLMLDGAMAQERVSRGQQKMLAAALWLAQVRRFTQERQERVCLLVDDLAAELDENHRERLIALLREQDAQLVLTAIEDADRQRSGLDNGRVFHVEHGCVSAV